MKIKYVLLILIIGIMSLNMVFSNSAGYDVKTFLVKGDLTITPALTQACNGGVNWTEGIEENIDDDQQNLSGSNQEEIFYFSSSQGCNIEIYNQANTKIYARNGLHANAIKQGLQNGIPLQLSIVSDTPIINVTVKIKKKLNNSELLSTIIKLPNPKAAGSEVSANLLLPSISTLTCNAENHGKIAIISGEFKKCCSQQHVCSPLGWQTFLSGSSTPNIDSIVSVFYNQQFQKYTDDANFSSIRLRDNFINLDHLDNNLKNRLGVVVESNEVQEIEIDDYNRYLRVKVDSGNWEYIKLYPAESFIYAQSRNLPLTLPVLGAPKVYIESNRIDMSTVSVNCNPSSLINTICTYNSGDDYFKVVAQYRGTDWVVISGEDNLGISRSYTAYYTFDDNYYPEDDDDDAGSQN
jgi:hypothetical protein